MPRQKSSSFNASKYVKQRVTLEQVQQIKSAFDLFDLQQSGYVNAKQIQAAMQSLGFDTKNRAIYSMISQLDTDGNGNIDFDLWYSLMTPKAPIDNMKAHYSRVFALYDEQRTGFIALSNIKRVAQDLGMALTDKEIQELIMRADQDGDGLVKQEEFYQILTYRK